MICVRLKLSTHTGIRTTLTSRNQTVQGVLGPILEDWYSRGCPLSEANEKTVEEAPEEIKREHTPSPKLKKAVREMTPKEIAELPEGVYQEATESLQYFMRKSLDDAGMDYPEHWVGF